MPISLIRSTKDEVVHGSDNDRRTGCGIRFQGVSSFSRIGEMKDITDMTCDRCKEIYATKLIKESNREEQRIEKEERKKFARAKKQGIVTEKSFEEYKSNREFEASSKREASKSSKSSLPPLKADMPQYIPGAGYSSSPAATQKATPVVTPAAQPQNIENENSAAAPSYEEYISGMKPSGQAQGDSNQTSSPVNPAVDDFLNQFMIKPQPAAANDIPAPGVPDMSENIISAADDILPTIHNEFEESVVTPPPVQKTSYSSPLEEAASKLRSTLSNTYGAQALESISLPDIEDINPTDTGINTDNLRIDNLTSGFDEQDISLINPFSQPDLQNNTAQTNDVGDIINSIDQFAYSTASADSSISNNSSYPGAQNTASSPSFADELDISGLDLDAALNSLDNNPITRNENSYQEPIHDLTDTQPDLNVQINQPQSMQYNPYAQQYNPSFSNMAQPDLSAASNVAQQFAPSPVQTPTQYGQSSVQPALQYGQTPVQPPVSQYTQSVIPQQYADPSASPVPPQYGQSVVQPPQFGQTSVQPPQYNTPQGMYGSADSMSSFNNGFMSGQAPQYQGYQNNMQSPFEPANVFNTQPAQPMSYGAQPPNAEPFKPQQRKSAVTPVFDSSDNINAKPPGFFSPMAQSIMVDSIEDALRQLGSAEVSESGSGSGKSDGKKDDVTPEYVPYVPSSSKTLYKNPPPADLKNNTSARQVSAKDAKKLAKIDAKFHKRLAEQGYNISEMKNQRRGK